MDLGKRGELVVVLVVALTLIFAVLVARIPGNGITGAVVGVDGELIEEGLGIISVPPTDEEINSSNEILIVESSSSNASPSEPVVSSFEPSPSSEIESSSEPDPFPIVPEKTEFVTTDFSLQANCGGGTACGCQDTVTSSYTMTGNLNCELPTAGGLIVGANSITIDCAGFKITGDGTAGNFGISNTAYDNVTIKNCNIFGFDYAISFYTDNSGDILGGLINNSNLSGVSVGIYLESNNTVINLTKVNNSATGVYIYQGTNVTVSYSNLSSNTNYDLYVAGLAGVASINKIYTNQISSKLKYDGSTSGIKTYNNNFYGAPILTDLGANQWNTSYSPDPYVMGLNIVYGEAWGGNYYSNYTGWDNETDEGIGDSLDYSIGGGGGSVDYLPLVKVYQLVAPSDPSTGGLDLNSSIPEITMRFGTNHSARQNITFYNATARYLTIDAYFNYTINLSGLEIFSNSSAVVINNLDMIDNISSYHTLYLNNSNLGNGIVVCPSAGSMSEVSQGCGGAVKFNYNDFLSRSKIGNFSITYDDRFYEINNLSETGITFNSNSSLVVWDETDVGMPHGGMIRNISEVAIFFANYTGSGNQSLNASNCTLYVEGEDPIQMTFNSTAMLFMGNFTFDTVGNYEWNATCSAKYISTLNADDNITINSPPVNCGIITESTTLTQNLTYSDTCFSIYADNIILDGAGYTISGVGYSGLGVYVLNRTNVTVNNINIKGFNTGIRFTNSNYSVISNSFMENNSVGVTLFTNSYFNFIYNLILVNNTEKSLDIDYSGLNNTIQNVTISTNFDTSSDGTLYLEGNGQLLDSIKIIRAPSIGLRLGISYNNTIQNSVFENIPTCIYLPAGGVGSRGNILVNNNFTSCTRYSILDDTDDDGSEGNILRYNNSFGEISWINNDSIGYNGVEGLRQSLTFNGTLGLGLNLYIDNNTFAFNTSAFAIGKFNLTPANITFFRSGIADAGQVIKLHNYTLSSGVILGAGENCVGSSCTILIENANKIVFNTTSLGSFSLVADASPTLAIWINPAGGANYSKNSFNITFNASVLEAYIDTVLFMFNNASGQDFNVSATNGSGYWSVSYNVSALAEGVNTVTIFANDTTGNVNKTESITFTTDYTLPRVSWISPNPGANYSFTAYNKTFNVSLFELYPYTVRFMFSNGSGADFNVTAENKSGYWSVSYNVSSLAEGANTVTVFANDSAGNVNLTQTIRFTMDYTLPAVSWISPANGTNYSKTAYNKTFNVSISEANIYNVLFMFTNGSNGGFNVTAENGSGYWSASYNLSSLAEGTNSVKVFVNDSVGYVNSTEYISFRTDLSIPSVIVITPNDTISIFYNLTSGNQTFNVSLLESYLYNVIFMFVNGSGAFNLTPENNSGYWSLSYNVSRMGEGVNRMTVFANDTVGNLNITESVMFTNNYTVWNLSCGVITESGTLFQNLTSTGVSCLTIEADNLIIDGAGYYINAEGISSKGIYVKNRTNITIKNIHLNDFGRGIDFENTNSSVVLNSTFENISSIGLYCEDCFKNIITNLSFKDVATGIYLYRTLNAGDLLDHPTTGENNTFTNITINTTPSGTGIYIDYSSKSLFDNINIINSNVGITIDDYSNNHTIRNSNLNANGTCVLIKYVSGDNLLLNNNFTSCGQFSVKRNNMDLIGWPADYLIYNNSYGDLRWLFNGTGSFVKNLTFNGSLGLGLNLFIGNSTFAINTSALTMGNVGIINRTPVNITLKSLGLPTINRIFYLHNFTSSSEVIISSGNDCYYDGSCRFISYSGSELVFNSTFLGSFAAQNDIFPPTMIIISPAIGSNYSLVSFNQTVNISLFERYPSGVIFMFSNGSGQDFNVSATNLSGYWSASYNVSSLAEGANTVTVFANDSAGNVNKTESITFTMDYTLPRVSWISLSSGSNYSKSSSNQTFNASVLELYAYNVIFQFSNGSGQDFNVSATNLSGYWSASYNVSSLAEGANTVTVFANDSAGNVNKTETISFTMDYTLPRVSWISLSSGSNYSKSSSNQTFNASVLELYAYNVIFQFSNGSGQDFNVSATNLSGYWSASYNVSSLAEGTNTVTVFANDSAGNVNLTQTISFTMDYTLPRVSWLSPTNGSIYNFSSPENATINVSVLEDRSISKVFAMFDNSSGNDFNLTLENQSGYWVARYNISLLVNGTQTITIFANDSANGINNTERIILIFSNITNPDPVIDQNVQNNGGGSRSSSSSSTGGGSSSSASKKKTPPQTETVEIMKIYPKGSEYSYGSGSSDSATGAAVEGTESGLIEGFASGEAAEAEEGTASAKKKNLFGQAVFSLDEMGGFASGNLVYILGVGGLILGGLFFLKHRSKGEEMLEDADQDDDSEEDMDDEEDYSNATRVNNFGDSGRYNQNKYFQSQSRKTVQKMKTPPIKIKVGGRAEVSAQAKSIWSKLFSIQGKPSLSGKNSVVSASAESAIKEIVIDSAKISDVSEDGMYFQKGVFYLKMDLRSPVKNGMILVRRVYSIVDGSGKLVYTTEKGRPNPHFVTAMKSSGEEEKVVITERLNLGKLPSGRYKLEVRIVNPLLQNEVERTLPLEIRK
jgi:hypothetical protein